MAGSVDCDMPSTMKEVGLSVEWDTLPRVVWTKNLLFQG